MFEKIVVPIDGSDESKKALVAAAALASKFGSKVTVLHVLEREQSVAGSFPLETEGEAAVLVHDAVEALEEEGVDVRYELRYGIHGQAARIILDVVQQEDAGLIVMGSRGLSDFTGLLLGSVTHKLLHLGSTPVLVVR